MAQYPMVRYHSHSLRSSCLCILSEVEWSLVTLLVFSLLRCVVVGIVLKQFLCFLFCIGVYPPLLKGRQSVYSGHVLSLLFVPP